jgi:hypothetical protein
MHWYVCDMDDGVLRSEPTRKAAVSWWRTHQGATRVIKRYTYAPGYYSYTVGCDRDHGSETAIVREDKLRVYGIDAPVGEIKPLYPYADRPHEMRADEGEHCESLAS